MHARDASDAQVQVQFPEVNKTTDMRGSYNENQRGHSSNIQIASKELKSNWNHTLISTSSGMIFFLISKKQNGGCNARSSGLILLGCASLASLISKTTNTQCQETCSDKNVSPSSPQLHLHRKHFVFGSLQKRPLLFVTSFLLIQLCKITNQPCTANPGKLEPWIEFCFLGNANSLKSQRGVTLIHRKYTR